MDDEGDTEQKLIQQQMEETRASLSTKLEALENQVAETVQTATDVVQSTKDAVAETVESVKETVGEITDKVGDTARSVAHAFDLSAQLQERPWLVFGGSIALGWLVGRYLPARARPRKDSRTTRSFAGSTPSAAAAYETAATPSAPPKYEAAAVPAEVKKPGWVSTQLTHLRGLAIGAVMGTVRDLAKHSLPEAISSRVADEVDSLTTHLGGEVVHGPILPESLFQPVSQPEEQRNGVGGQPPSGPPAEGEKTKGRPLVSEWS